MKRLNTALLFDYYLLTARIWMALILIHYGTGKLVGGQFGVDATTLNTPLKDVSLFKLCWYLADHEPFKSFIGISQIVCAILMILRPTFLAGLLMSIPIWLNIMVWDMSFMSTYMATAFVFRLSYYLLLTGIILWRHRQKLLPALAQLEPETQSRYSYPLVAVLLIPVAGFAVEFLTWPLEQLYFRLQYPMIYQH